MNGFFFKDRNQLKTRISKNIQGTRSWNLPRVEFFGWVQVLDANKIGISEEWLIPWSWIVPDIKFNNY